MGVWICSEEEIFEAIEVALNGLQGDVYKDDYKKAHRRILKEYEYFTDEDE